MDWIVTEPRAKVQRKSSKPKRRIEREKRYRRDLPSSENSNGTILEYFEPVSFSSTDAAQRDEWIGEISDSNR